MRSPYLEARCNELSQELKQVRKRLDLAEEAASLLKSKVTRLSKELKDLREEKEVKKPDVLNMEDSALFL